VDPEEAFADLVVIINGWTCSQSIKVTDDDRYYRPGGRSRRDRDEREETNPGDKYQAGMKETVAESAL
jgi:hypothetical protein